MQDHATGGFLRVFDPEEGVACRNHAGISRLAAAFPIERGDVQHQHGLIPFVHRFRRLIVPDDGGDAGGGREHVISYEATGHELFEDPHARLPGILPGLFPRRPGPLALLGHQPVELLFVHL